MDRSQCLYRQIIFNEDESPKMLGNQCPTISRRTICSKHENETADVYLKFLKYFNMESKSVSPVKPPTKKVTIKPPTPMKPKPASPVKPAPTPDPVKDTIEPNKLMIVRDAFNVPKSVLGNELCEDLRNIVSRDDIRFNYKWSPKVDYVRYDSLSFRDFLNLPGADGYMRTMDTMMNLSRDISYAKFREIQPDTPYITPRSPAGRAFMLYIAWLAIDVKKKEN